MRGCSPVGALVRAARAAGRRGLVPATSGNISGRRGTHVWISTTGAVLGELTAERVVRVTMTGEVATGDRARASSEVWMHRAIYRKLDAAGAILHVHGVWMTVVGHLTRDAAWRPRSASVDLRVLAGEKSVAVVPHLPEGSGRLAEAAGSAADPDGAPALLLRGHGGVAWGRTPRQALHHAEMLEQLAKIDYHVRFAGREPGPPGRR